MIFLFIITFLLGTALGACISNICNKNKQVRTIGTLRVDTSDPDDAPYLFLEIENKHEIEEIMLMKHATFKIDTRSYISQK